MRSHSTLLPTFHNDSFGSSNTSPSSVVRVAMWWWSSIPVIVATTPCDTGGKLDSPARLRGTSPPSRRLVTSTAVQVRIIGVPPLRVGVLLTPRGLYSL